MDTAATPLEPQDLPPKLTALLRMQPDYVLRFTSDGDAPVPVHRPILSLNSSVLRDVLPLAAGGDEGCIPRGTCLPDFSAKLCDLKSSVLPNQTMTVTGSRAAWVEILLRCYVLQPSEDLVSGLSGNTKAGMTCFYA